MADIKGALQKFSMGAGLSDNELNLLLDHFNRVEADLGLLQRHFSNDFSLARHMALHNIQTLEQFKMARGRRAINVE